LIGWVMSRAELSGPDSPNRSRRNAGKVGWVIFRAAARVDRHPTDQAAPPT
jgi:hypothetical protein